ncbi:hypothetical protein IVB30_35190 [Bradyrhizobium sp. 200]|uniref:hypothetical protein n=1 Tax=Bradyrhizobium sp. 200 TaxID=2782665 RepID=UPI001FFFF9F4|nr:hypothetical protein [Bradyrhizobium sp. 200]UPJ48271.1 hypothetical protein IVB30_35190 [Bradyrhizobium sp. 200]
MSVSADTFTRERPDIEQSDAIEAAKRARIVTSFNAHPISNADGSYDAIAIKWKLADGTTETMLVGQYAALVLRMMFSQLEVNKWTELATLLPDATRQ